MKKLLITLFAICLTSTSCTVGTTLVSSLDSNVPTSSMPIPDKTPGAGFILNVTAEAGGSVPAELSGTYPAGELIQLTALPEPGFRFHRWITNSDNPEDSQISHRNPIQYATRSHDVTITATFKEESVIFHIDIIIDRSGLVTEGEPLYSGNFLEGEEVARGFILRPPLGWPFEKWIIYSSNYEVMGTIDRGVNTFVMPPYDVILVAEYSEREIVY